MDIQQAPSATKTKRRSFDRENGYRLTVLLTDREHEGLDRWCDKHAVSKAEAIRTALRSLIAGDDGFTAYLRRLGVKIHKGELDDD